MDDKNIIAEYDYNPPIWAVVGAILCSLFSIVLFLFYIITEDSTLIQLIIFLNFPYLMLLFTFRPNKKIKFYQHGFELPLWNKKRFIPYENILKVEVFHYYTEVSFCFSSTSSFLVFKST